jgi:hypothetical protein
MKPSVKSETNPSTNPEPATQTNLESATVRILKIASCPSLSGKSTLTYRIGCEVNDEGICTAESDPQFRIVDNTNIGFFSREWVPMSVIQREFDKVPVGMTITSFLLHALFRGKSVNTPAFLFAVLKNEGLVQPAKDKQRQYERMDPAGFLSMVRALIASKVELKWDEPVKKGAGTSKTGTGELKTGAESEKSGAKSKGKTAKVDAKTVAVKPTESPSQTEASPTQSEASPPKIPIKSANGVDIAEIVEVINAKVDASPSKTGAKPAEEAQRIDPNAKPAMPAKKTAAKAKQ